MVAVFNGINGKYAIIIFGVLGLGAWFYADLAYIMDTRPL